MPSAGPSGGGAWGGRSRLEPASLSAVLVLSTLAALVVASGVILLPSTSPPTVPTAGHAYPLSAGGAAPLAGGTTGSFFQNTSTVASSAFVGSPKVCNSAPRHQATCDPASAAPSLVPLSNGNVGIGYWVVVNRSQSVCRLPENESVGHVAF